MSDQERAAVRDAARSWIGTRYKQRMAMKGIGCDCAQLILASFAEAGLGIPYDPGRYSSDWHLHKDDEQYLSVVGSYMAAERTDLRPAKERGNTFAPAVSDVLMWKVGRTFSHSALVTEWPRVVHASLPDRMVVEVDVRGTILSELPMVRCSYWGIDA